jgi:hypothetical protein
MVQIVISAAWPASGLVAISAGFMSIPYQIERPRRSEGLRAPFISRSIPPIVGLRVAPQKVFGVPAIKRL